MKHRSLGFFILIALVLAAIAALVFWLLPAGQPQEIPVVLAQSAPVSADEAETADRAAYSELEITPDTVQAAVDTLARAEDYSRVLRVERFWSGGSSSDTIGVYRSGNSLRVDIEPSGGTAKEYLRTDGTLWVRYGDSGRTWRRDTDGSGEDALSSIPTYEDLLALDQSRIREAGYLEYNGEMCIFARYTAGRMNYDYHAYVSIETGLLNGCEIYDGEQLIYRMTVIETEIAVPDEALFALTQE